MLTLLLVSLCVGGALSAGQHATTTPVPKTDHELIQDLINENAAMKTKMEHMSSMASDLTRQVMLQQLFVEERIRTDGTSGVKQVRSQSDGTRPYYVPSTANNGVAGLHEHANNARTVGMGELDVVLNGVEFRTRHNDYSLRMPANNSQYGATEDIPFPDVPPEVLAKSTVQEQILEMREWFRAFKEQNHTVRDYRKYFKPVLTYLEGGWTTNTKSLEEPFESDRHHIDATSWFDLQDKVRFTSYSGEKSVLENYAYLPTSIINVNANGTPEFAQWNYRIVVHPLKNDLPVNLFMPVDDLADRMTRKTTMDQHIETRRCRFNLMAGIPHNPNQAKRFMDTTYKWGLLDDLMYEIPGKDNYPGVIHTNSMGQTITNIKDHSQPYEALNAARYHRWYRIEERDAMGTKSVHRGFSDANLFVAQTTNPKISGLSMERCKRHYNKHTHHQWTNCTTYTERVTYAVPLEIIYMTPLSAWNPYNLTYSSDKNTVLSGPNGNRNGNISPDKAFNGTYRKAYYRTPAEFYHTSQSVGKDVADTAKGVAGVLDQQGVIRKVAPSGTRIVMPDIDGVGRIRTRYPIMPFHAEGENTRKELEALKDMVMKMSKFSSLYEEPPTASSLANQQILNKEFTLMIAPTTHDPPGLHDHEVTIHQSDIDEMKNGHIVRGLLSSIQNGHQHSIDVQMNGTNYFMVSCDGMSHCWDGHSKRLILQT